MNNVGGCPSKEVQGGGYYDGRIQQQPSLPPGGPNELFHDSMQKYTESYFWRKLAADVEHTTPANLRNLKMPLARVKRMIKSDDEVKMLSAEAPIILSKGCEMFIGELALRCWFHTKCNKRKTLQKADIVNAVCGTGMYDYVISCDDVSKSRSTRPSKDESLVSGMQPLPLQSGETRYGNGQLIK